MGCPQGADATTPPIVDCGVHYVDVMCQITDARPVEVRGMGLRLSDEIAPDMYNYGHFQVLFDDGSLGWYEAGWGPMMSDTAFFVKDVVSPNGAVSIRMSGKRALGRYRHPYPDLACGCTASASPIRTCPCRASRAIRSCATPRPAFMARAIAEDADLTRHMQDAVAPRWRSALRRTNPCAPACL
jgi:predicted dehydrogenase